MHKIDPEKCIACAACVGTCPQEAIVEDASVYKITDACVDCGACVESCPVEAISEQ